MTGSLDCRRTAVEFAVVRYHQHHFPLEYVVVDQAARDAGDVLVALHLLQLAAQEPRRG